MTELKVGDRVVYNKQPWRVMQPVFGALRSALLINPVGGWVVEAPPDQVQHMAPIAAGDTVVWDTEFMYQEGCVVVEYIDRHNVAISVPGGDVCVVWIDEVHPKLD